MKKILLTSTALVGLAGAAAAEVTISGSAEMGVFGGENLETQFVQSIDVDFTLSGETDGGLTFGGSIDLADVNDGDSGGDDLSDTTGFADYTVFVSGEFGTVTMGDTDGALDWALTDPASVGNPGSLLDNETGHGGRQDSYLDGSYDGQVLRYDYAYEGFGFAVSVEQDDEYETENDYNWAIGAKWAGETGPGTLTLGVGYQAADSATLTLGSDDFEVKPFEDAEDATVWGLSATYAMDNGFSVGAVYSDWDADELDSGSHWAIGAGYSFDAFSIHANYGEHSFELDGGGDIDIQGWGIAAGYDLGGGLSVLAGYGSSTGDIDTPTLSVDDGETDNWSLGLSMAF